MCGQRDYERALHAYDYRVGNPQWETHFKTKSRMHRRAATERIELRSNPRYRREPDVVGGGQLHHDCSKKRKGYRIPEPAIDRQRSAFGDKAYLSSSIW